MAQGKQRKVGPFYKGCGGPLGGVGAGGDCFGVVLSLGNISVTTLGLPKPNFAAFAGKIAIIESSWIVTATGRQTLLGM